MTHENYMPCFYLLQTANVILILILSNKERIQFKDNCEPIIHIMKRQKNVGKNKTR